MTSITIDDRDANQTDNGGEGSSTSVYPSQDDEVLLLTPLKVRGRRQPSGRNRPVKPNRHILRFIQQMTLRTGRPPHENAALLSSCLSATQLSFPDSEYADVSYEPEATAAGSKLLQSLPFEIIEEIFLMSENANFALASPLLGRALSHRVVLTQFALSQLNKIWALHMVRRPLRDPKAPPLQNTGRYGTGVSNLELIAFDRLTTLIRYKWFNYDMAIKCLSTFIKNLKACKEKNGGQIGLSHLVTGRPDQWDFNVKLPQRTFAVKCLHAHIGASYTARLEHINYELSTIPVARLHGDNIFFGSMFNLQHHDDISRLHMYSERIPSFSCADDMQRSIWFECYRLHLTGPPPGATDVEENPHEKFLIRHLAPNHHLDSSVTFQKWTSQWNNEHPAQPLEMAGYALTHPPLHLVEGPWPRRSSSDALPASLTAPCACGKGPHFSMMNNLAREEDVERVRMLAFLSAMFTRRLSPTFDHPRTFFRNRGANIVYMEDVYEVLDIVLIQHARQVEDIISGIVPVETVPPLDVMLLTLDFLQLENTQELWYFEFRQSPLFYECRAQLKAAEVALRQAISLRKLEAGTGDEYWNQPANRILLELCAGVQIYRATLDFRFR